MKAAQRWKLFLRDDSGVTVIEYALLGALIVIVAVGGIGATGSDLAATWGRISSLVASSIRGG